MFNIIINLVESEYSLAYNIPKLNDNINNDLNPNNCRFSKFKEAYSFCCKSKSCSEKLLAFEEELVGSFISFLKDETQMKCHSFEVMNNFDNYVFNISSGLNEDMRKYNSSHSNCLNPPQDSVIKYISLLECTGGCDDNNLIAKHCNSDTNSEYESCRTNTTCSNYFSSRKHSMFVVEYDCCKNLKGSEVILLFI